MTNNTKTLLSFGPERFEKLATCKTYPMSGGVGNRLNQLLDHGFMADRACVWEKSLDGHELAVVARTYCSDEEIDNPPAGLKCVRLPPQVMGAEDLGTPIAVVVTAATSAAEDLLSCFTGMPADMLVYGLSLAMQNADYAVLLDTSKMANSPVVKIVKNKTAVTAGIEMKRASEYVLPKNRGPVNEALALISEAERIARSIVDERYPPDRVDSVTWRLADALLVLRDYAKDNWPGSPTPGANVPTGRGAMLAKETPTP